MSRKHLIIVAAATAVVAGGAVGAIAATGDDAKKTEQSILADAAKRLNVSPDDLRTALGAAEDAQLDQAVKDGKLTKEQADAIKAQRAKEGRVLGIPPGGHGGPGVPGGPGFGFHGHGRSFGPGLRPGFDGLGDVAKALGTSRSDLLKDLSSGKTISAIAKAHGKSLTDVRNAVKDAAGKRLDAEVKAGRLTDAQRKAILSEISERIGRLGELRFDRSDHFGPGPPRPGPPPAFGGSEGGAQSPMPAGPPQGYPAF